MFSEYRKAAVAAATFVSQAIAFGLLTGTAEKWATVALGVLGAFGVYRLPNDPGILVEWDDLRPWVEGPDA